MDSKSSFVGINYKGRFAFPLFLLMLGILLSLPPVLSAAPFKIVGARPAGMGGAYVGIADSALAQHWNPAGLVSSTEAFDVQVPFTANVELTKNILKRSDELTDVGAAIDAVQNKTAGDDMDLDDYVKFTDSLDKINALNEDGMGVLAGVNGGVNMRIKRFAFSATTFVDIGADPFVDITNVGLYDATTGSISDQIDAASGADTTDNSYVTASSVTELADVISDASARLGLDLGALTAEQAAYSIINEAHDGGATQAEIEADISAASTSYDSVSSSLPTAGALDGTNSFDNNETNLTVTGSSITEFAFGSAMKLKSEKKWLSDISIGANLKVMQGKVGYTQIQVMDEQADSENVVKDFLDNAETTSQFGVDVGVMLDRRKKSRYSVGIVGKNLNSPKFKAPTGGVDQEYKPQLRAGAAFWPFKRWVFAADVDLTENDTVLTGYKSRQMSIGTEFKLFNSRNLDLALRVGRVANMAESDSSPTITAGLGLSMLHMTLDIAGGMSQEETTLEDGSTAPSNAYVSAMLSMEF